MSKDQILSHHNLNQFSVAICSKKMFKMSIARRVVSVTKNSRQMSSGHSAEQIKAEIVRWKQFTYGETMKFFIKI